MSSQDVRRSQRVAVPSSKVLENAPACVRVFWSYISEAVKSNTEDRTEIRTLIANIRKAYADLTEIGEPSDDVCYGCLVQGHKSTACYKRSVCNECKGRHPTSIHGMYEALHPSSKPITNNNKSDGSTRKELDTSDSTHTKDERDTSSSTTKKYPRHDVKMQTKTMMSGRRLSMRIINAP